MREYGKEWQVKQNATHVISVLCNTTIVRKEIWKELIKRIQPEEGRLIKSFGFD